MISLQYKRSKEWWDFSKQVIDHIESYTVPQHGDKGKDKCTDFNESDFIEQMQKYLDRYADNNPSKQQALDLIKIAHYAGMFYSKLTAKDKDERR